jgi:Fe-S-cluster-containing hydrogenase component 2
MLPDMRANSDAALLAGLAYPGLHGCPITPQYGIRQRFMAVVTDYPLPDDPLLVVPPACDSCAKPCVRACPTKAIGRARNPLMIGKAEFNLGRIDCYACDWAKRYCLSAEEGPRYMGVETTQPLPKKRTLEAAAAAISRVNLGVQKRHLAVAEECLRVCPAHLAHRR